MTDFKPSFCPDFADGRIHAVLGSIGFGCKAAFAVAVFFAVVTVLTRSPEDPQTPRAGLFVACAYVDEATGCEYLGGPFGPSTPRLAADGSHMGCREE